MRLQLVSQDCYEPKIQEILLGHFWRLVRNPCFPSDSGEQEWECNQPKVEECNQNTGELISSTRIGGLPSATHDHGVHENEDLGIHRLGPLHVRSWSIVWLRYLGRAQQAHIRKWPRLRFPEFLYPPKKKA